jgi:acyl carrier protein
MSDILERVRKIVIEHLDADPEKVTEEFDIEIPDDAAEHIQTVGDAVKFIGERLGG